MGIAIMDPSAFDAAPIRAWVEAETVDRVERERSMTGVLQGKLSSWMRKSRHEFRGK